MRLLNLLTSTEDKDAASGIVTVVTRNNAAPVVISPLSSTSSYAAQICVLLLFDSFSIPQQCCGPVLDEKNCHKADSQVYSGVRYQHYEVKDASSFPIFSS